ncbi:cell wall integrity and stress response component 3 [Scheffersomyces stipitis CBS 6054]|uniref:Cell wall integrity and stress response component 3 n=1 Tax=Scheffersomyces stipitis (strain ATCC 58785 / CBS 6054 / NBRC 10063 / NRRL Y-11545) TaxID=322104 RepID=A3GFB7_PICST|nr:cell wall integrity and stress response component 3 [Scheffersomyces stipitis CBS 6054]EAZ63728.2 cell wall integrity and stress response component 3 [Scheffersomyces stipitis CBS 6054]
MHAIRNVEDSGMSDSDSTISNSSTISFSSLKTPDRRTSRMRGSTASTSTNASFTSAASTFSSAASAFTATTASTSLTRDTRDSAKVPVSVVPSPSSTYVYTRDGRLAPCVAYVVAQLKMMSEQASEDKEAGSGIEVASRRGTTLSNVQVIYFNNTGPYELITLVDNDNLGRIIDYEQIDTIQEIRNKIGEKAKAMPESTRLVVVIENLYSILESPQAQLSYNEKNQLLVSVVRKATSGTTPYALFLVDKEYSSYVSMLVDEEVEV